MKKITSLLYTPLLKLQRIQFGRNLNLYGFPLIVKNHNAEIRIGDNCHIRSSFLSNLVGLNHRTIICAREKGKIIIGDNVGISGATIYSRSLVKIGDKCVIGGNVKILDNDFHPVDPDVRYSTPCENFKAAPIIIGDNVFIGCNSLILKGVTIEGGAVVGAGSVVTKDVPENTLVAGNPAQEIRKLK